MKSRTLIITSLLICSAFLNKADGSVIPTQRRLILFILRSPSFRGRSGGQGTTKNGPPASRIIRQSNTVELDMSYDFTTTGETRRLILIAVIPKTIPDRQKIIDIQYSKKPSRIFEENDNHYAEFIFNKPDKEIKIDIKIKAELLRYDLNTAKRKRPPPRLASADAGAGTTDHTEGAGLAVNRSGTWFAEFLKSEKYIEKDHQEIQQIADELEGRTEEEVVKKIYNYVTEHLDYAKHGNGQWGAVKALHEGKGDCSEYSDLFVALCRAKNIPARVITGCTVRLDSDSPKHNWVEVYLKDYGWVPFDPSGGDVDNERIRNFVFGRMAPVYVYFSHIRNDEILRNYHFASYRYWGDKVKLKDSIEFMQPASSNSK